MMHEEDEGPPNEKAHANHLSITYKVCEICLLTPMQIVLSPNAYLKDGFCRSEVSFV